MNKKIKAGIVGLGRLGKEYARNLSFKIRNAELVAACSIVPEELEFVEKELGISTVFSDFDNMLKNSELDAVFVISSTDKHAEHIIKGLEAGLHVFSEKPLAITLEEYQKVEAVASKYSNIIKTRPILSIVAAQ